MKNLLVELLVEELPPKALKKLGLTFGNELFKALESRDLLGTGATLTSYASPRRLAAHISNVLAISSPKECRTKLMPISVALDSGGKPTPALIKKMMSLDYHDQVNFERILKERVIRESDGKNEFLVHVDMAAGNPLQVGLQEALQDSLDDLPIPRVMTYQLADGWSSVNFVRPAHALIALHGAEIVPVSVLGLTAGRETQGHRFEASVNPVVLKDADSYTQQLETEGAVIANYEERRLSIIRQLREQAGLLGYRLEVEPGAGLLFDAEAEEVLEDDALIQEVTALVERPNVLVGQFEDAFLEVPQECLILTMKANQKYFPLLDANGKLTNKFLIVSNIRPADASLVVSGNERVLRARLADARFFFDQDRKKTLDSRVLGLAKVVYHNKLGSQGDRVMRVQAIARAIGQQLGGDALALQADQAALLAKADLLTDMVSEFPELQGIMGRYYAQHDGVNDDIAYAIEDHYKPRFAGDELPRNMVGICVALADKLETLVGMFSIGQIPTGDKDPFALRRHALGVIRILIEKNLNIHLIAMLKDAAAIEWLERCGTNILADSSLERTIVELERFIHERLSGLLREQGYSAQEIDAVISLRPELFADVPKRLAAVRAFAALPEAASLAAANKRVSNILKKAESDFALRQAQGERLGIDTALLQEPAEQSLHQILSQIAPKADAAFAAGDYTASLQALAALKEPVDTFFDKVMVNTEDAALRTNRLALLLQLQHAMNRVADISKLAT